MNFFELSWSWYEDYQPYIFYHKNKTKKDFNKDVKNLFRKYGDEYIESEESWIGAPVWVGFIADKLPELGYKRVNQQIPGFNVFGAYIIDGDDSEDEEFSKIIGKRLYKKVIKRNKERNKEIRKELELMRK